MNEATAEFLRLRKAAYQSLGAKAREDLAGFCRADESCWAADARMHALLEGRREVWLRIRQHLDLSIDELGVIYGAVNLETTNG